MFAWDQRMTIHSFQTCWKSHVMTYSCNSKTLWTDLLPLPAALEQGHYTASPSSMAKPLSRWPCSWSVDSAPPAPGQLPASCWLSLSFLMTGSSWPSISWSGNLGGKPTELGRIQIWFSSQTQCKAPTMPAHWEAQNFWFRTVLQQLTIESYLRSLNSTESKVNFMIHKHLKFITFFIFY